MRYVNGVALIGETIFGGSAALVRSLLGFVAQMSLVLWGLVILTTVLRFVSIVVYRRATQRKALRWTDKLNSALPAPRSDAGSGDRFPSADLIPDAPIDDLRSAAVTSYTFEDATQLTAASPGALRPRARSSEHVPVFALCSTEA